VMPKTPNRPKVPESAVECTGKDMYVEGGLAGLRYTWAGLSAMALLPYVSCQTKTEYH
jgi:hypothetical protein